MKFRLVCAAALVLGARMLSGGILPSSSVSPAAVAYDVVKPWEFSLSAYSYLIPDEQDYIQPTLTADHDWLHLEARYNYEGLKTGSAWIGYNFNAGEDLTLEFTPMLGGVFGNTRGIAPGCEISLDWKKLSFYSETEYLIDSQDSSRDYLYTWLTFTYAPWDWLSLGLVAQRTRIHGSDLDLERGLLVGITWKKVEFTTCVFFPGSEQPTVVLGVTLNF